MTEVPIEVGALGTVLRILEKRLKVVEIEGRIETIQTIALLLSAILSTQIKEEIYYPLYIYELFPKEQKACHKRTRETDDLLYTDHHTFKEVKEKCKMCT